MLRHAITNLRYSVPHLDLMQDRTSASFNSPAVGPRSESVIINFIHQFGCQHRIKKNVTRRDE